MQDDKFNLTDLPEWKADCLKRLDLLDQSRVVGGWEAAFYKDFDQEKNIFHGEQLNEKNRNPRRNEHHRYVSESSRSFPAVRYETLESLKNLIKERLSYDEMLSSMLKNFFFFRSNDNELVNVDEKIAADLSLPCLSEEYIDAKNIPALKSLSFLESVEYFSRMKEFSTLCTVYARIAACTAHSADVERVISLYNQLKTADHSSLSNETLAHNLYVNMNMPTLAEFDQRPAALYWMSEKRHRAVEPSKAIQQELFVQTFREATDIQKLNKKKDKEPNKTF